MMVVRITRKNVFMIRNLLLSAALILVPVAGFSAVEYWLGQRSAPAVAAPAGLGDLSAFKGIVTDVQAIAATGDLVAAEKRVSDFETAWDDAEATMRPQDPAAWGQVDDAADAAFSALRAGNPDAAAVAATLAGLSQVLDAPQPQAGGSAGVTFVEGIAVTDETGHPIACEKMLADLGDAIATVKQPPATLTQVTDLRDKATERCNADDDARSNGFSAQALALLAKQN